MFAGGAPASGTTKGPRCTLRKPPRTLGPAILTKPGRAFWRGSRCEQTRAPSAGWLLAPAPMSIDDATSQRWNLALGDESYLQVRVMLAIEAVQQVPPGLATFGWHAAFQSVYDAGGETNTHVPERFWPGERTALVGMGYHTVQDVFIGSIERPL